jgi:transcriptional regulator with XRE-family HTH domain
METEPNRLGSFLSALRRSKGLSLRAVEAETGISNAYLSQLETGKIREPSPAHLYKLSEVYGVSYAMLFEHAGYPVPESPRRGLVANRLAARLGPTTKEEEDALAEYLAFLRSKRTRRSH